MEKCLLCLVLEETSAWCNAHKKTTLERSGRWWRAACTQQGAPWDGGFTKSNTRKPRRVCRVFRFHIFKEKSTLALKTQNHLCSTDGRQLCCAPLPAPVLPLQNTCTALAKGATCRDEMGSRCKVDHSTLP